MKRIIAILTTVFLFATSLGFVFAEEPAAVEQLDAVQSRIVSLGIMQGYEDGSFRPEETLSRAEFAAVIVRLLRISSASMYQDEPSLYTDVGDDFWAKSDIMLVTKLGYMNGVGGGLFLPDADATIQQAAKVLTTVLGYGALVSNPADGYGAYMTQAARIGLLKGIQTGTDEAILRGELARMIDNALDIDLLVEVTKNGQTAYEVDSGNTLLGTFLSDGAEKKGVVEATRETSLVGDVNLAEDEVLIDGYSYHVGATNAKELLGQSVSFYIQEIDSEVVIQGIYPQKNRNQELQLKGRDINSATDKKLTYYDADDREQSIDIAQITVVYNGRVKRNFQPQQFQNANVSARFLDNDGDDTYEYAFVSAYELAETLKLNDFEQEIYLKNTLSSGKRSISYKESKDQTVLLVNAKGETIEPEAFNEEELMLEVYTSSDGRNVKVVLLDEKINGVVGAVETGGNASVVVDGENYLLAGDAGGYFVSPASINVGSAYVFTLDSNGEIVKMEEDTEAGDYRYAYIYAISSPAPGGLTRQLDLKLMSGTKVSMVEENRKYYIKAVDKQELYQLPVAQRVVIDGVLYKDVSEAGQKLAEIHNPSSKPELARGNVIKYKVNAAGEINRIEILNPKGDYLSRKLNAKQRVLGGDANPFGMDDETIVFFVPKSGQEDDIACEMRFGEGSYYSLGFELKEDKPIARTAIIQSPLSVFDTSDFGSEERTKIVQAVTEGINADGESVFRISGYNRNAVFNMTTRPGIQSVEEIMSKLRCGDLVQFSTDSDGQINRIRRITSVPAGNEYYHTGESTATELIYGIAQEAQSDTLSEGATEYNNRLVISLDEAGIDTKPFLLTVDDSTAPDIYVYHGKQQKVTSGDFKDILSAQDVGTESASRVLLYATESVVKAIIIVK